MTDKENANFVKVCTCDYDWNEHRIIAKNPLCPIHGKRPDVTVTQSNTCADHPLLTYTTPTPPKSVTVTTSGTPPAETDIEKLIDDLLDSYLRGHDCECESGRCPHVGKYHAAREALREGVRKLVEGAVEEERRACARIAEQLSESGMEPAAANKIRARARLSPSKEK